MRSLYRDLRAYPGASFWLTESATKSGDLILGMRVLLWDREFRSIAARSRHEDHAAMGTVQNHSGPLKAAGSWLWSKAVGSWRLRQGKFKISKLVELMYWGGRQRAAISSKSMQGWTAGSWMLVKTASSQRQWSSYRHDHGRWIK